MMKNLSTNFWQYSAPWLAILLSGGLWLGALAFEHIGGYHPCQMCYWQRHAHKAVLAVAILALCARYIPKTKTWGRGFLALIGLAFLVSFYLAFWHMGVEYKWWEGPKTCSAAASALPVNANDISNIFEKGVKMPACSDAPWHLFTISMAGYNALFSGLAALLSFIFVLKWKNV